MLVRSNQITELAMLASICIPASAIQTRYAAENKVVHAELKQNKINLDECERSSEQQGPLGSQMMIFGTGPCPIIVARSYEERGQTKFGHRNASRQKE